MISSGFYIFFSWLVLSDFKFGINFGDLGLVFRLKVV